jgi:hypothetical protein
MEFMNEYIKQVRIHKLYLVELKTAVFKFFMDIDYVSGEKLNRDEIITISKRVNDKIPGRCLVAVSRSKVKDEKIKSGIHLHWPNLRVTKKRALELRDELDEDIKKFVDESVYKGSGLRMLWSHKKGDDYPYLPLVDLFTGEFFSQEPNIDILNLFSIRTNEASDEREVKKDSDSKMEHFVNKYVDGHDMTRLKKMSKKGRFWKCECDSKFCENKGSQHKSNHVYFVIDSCKWTLHQECFDETCKGFKGKMYKLSQSIIDVFKNSSVSHDFGSLISHD